MADMTLQQVSHLLTKKGVMPSRELRQKMADAIDAHITQPAQAVDVGAWRACYGAIIHSLAVMARAGAPDSWPEDAIRRDPVMDEVCRIRQAIDTYGKLTRAIGTAQEGWVPSDDDVRAWKGRNDVPLSVYGCRTAIEDARIMHHFIIEPTPPTDGEG